MSVKKDGDFDIGIYSGLEKEAKRPKVKSKKEREILPIFDRLYKGTEMKLDLELMKRRLRINKGQNRKLTLM